MSEIVNEILGGKGGGGGAGLTPAEKALLATVPNKQDKVIPSAVGNIQGLDATGNSTDTGKKFNDAGTTANDVWSAFQIQNAIDAKQSGLELQGDWDANTNTPNIPAILTSPLYKIGYYWNVTVAGTQFGIDWTVGDKAAIKKNSITGDLFLDIEDFNKNASQISYNNTTSGAISTNVQDLGDELAQEIDDKVDKINTTAQSNIGSAAKTATITINTEGQVTALTEQNIAIASNQVSQAIITPTSGSYANGDTQEQINNKGQGQFNEAFARIITVEKRPVGNSGEGKKYYISTPATAGVYLATDIFTESPTTITKTFTASYQTLFEAETQALNITAIPSGEWNTDISFTHTHDKDFTAKVSFYNGATLLGEIESVILAGNEKIALSKTFPEFIFTSGNKLRFKLEVKSNHNGNISVYTNDGINQLHIHTPILIDVVNSAVQNALNLKVDKVAGKGLSTNDYTTAEKNKLAGIAAGATANDTDANLKNRANHTGTQSTTTVVQTNAPAPTNATIAQNDTQEAVNNKLQGQINAIPTVKNNKEWYVSNNAGDDTYNGYSPNTAFKTLSKLNAVLGNTGEVGILLPSQLTESATFAQLNVEIKGANAAHRASSGTSGTITSNNANTGSQTYAYLTLGSFAKTGAGYVTLYDLGITTSLSDNSSGVIDAYNLSFGSTATLSITGTGIKNFFNQRGGILTVNNANAQVNIVTKDYIPQFTLTAGTLAITDAIVYIAQGTTLTIGAVGTIFVANNVKFLYPDNTVAKINIPTNSLYSLQNCVYDKTNSTESGIDISSTYPNYFGTLKVKALNLPNLTASQRLETDANKNVISVAKGTADNKNYSTTATDIKVNGIQSVGTLDTLPRADHIHPTDTTREAVANKVSTFSATPNHTNYATEKLIKDSLDLKLDTSLKGSINGVAELGSDGKVPSSQLPSFVDDVLEFANFSSFPATGETGKIYIAVDTNITYRWSGTIYVEISSGKTPLIINVNSKEELLTLTTGGDGNTIKLGQLVCVIKGNGGVFYKLEGNDPTKIANWREILSNGTLVEKPTVFIAFVAGQSNTESYANSYDALLDINATLVKQWCNRGVNETGNTATFTVTPNGTDILTLGSVANWSIFLRPNAVIEGGAIPADTRILQSAVGDDYTKIRVSKNVPTGVAFTATVWRYQSTECAINARLIGYRTGGTTNTGVGSKLAKKLDAPLKTNTNDMILVLPVFNGSTGFSNAGAWVKNTGYLYNSCVTEYNLAKNYYEALGYNVEFRLFTWCQGEEDARQNMNTATYQQHLLDLCNGLKAACLNSGGVAPNPSFLFYGIHTWWRDNNLGYSRAETIPTAQKVAIDNGLRNMPAVLEGGAYITCETTAQDYNSQSDCIHFNGFAAERFANLAIRAIPKADKNKSTANPSAPDNVVINGNQTIGALATWDALFGKFYQVEWKYSNQTIWTKSPIFAGGSYLITCQGSPPGDPNPIKIDVRVITRTGATEDSVAFSGNIIANTSVFSSILNDATVLSLSGIETDDEYTISPLVYGFDNTTKQLDITTVSGADHIHEWKNKVGGTSIKWLPLIHGINGGADAANNMRLAGVINPNSNIITLGAALTNIRVGQFVFIVEDPNFNLIPRQTNVTAINGAQITISQTLPATVASNTAINVYFFNTPFINQAGSALTQVNGTSAGTPNRSKVLNNFGKFIHCVHLRNEGAALVNLKTLDGNFSYSKTVLLYHRSYTNLRAVAGANLPEMGSAFGGTVDIDVGSRNYMSGIALQSVGLLCTMWRGGGSLRLACNHNSLSGGASDNVDMVQSKWYLYTQTFNRATGIIKLYKNGVYISQATNTSTLVSFIYTLGGIDLSNGIRAGANGANIAATLSHKRELQDSEATTLKTYMQNNFGITLD